MELKEFRQKDSETIEVYYDHLNELIYRCNRYRIIRSVMEFNLTFLMGLLKEWRSVSMMVKNQKSFDTSSINDLYNQLKTHESQVNEIAEESKLSLGVPLALVSKCMRKKLSKKVIPMMKKDSSLILMMKQFLLTRTTELKSFSRTVQSEFKTKRSKTYEREKVDNISYDCEKNIAEFDNVTDDRYAYGIVKIDECLDSDELVNIVNETLTKSEQIKILKKTENSISDSYSNFSDIDDNSDNISLISDIEDVDCCQLSIINVTSKSRGKEIFKNSNVKIDTDKPSTSKVFYSNFVDIRESQTDDSDDVNDDEVQQEPTSNNDSKENEIPQICTDDVRFPNQVFVTTGNVEKVQPEFKKLVEEANKKTIEEGYFSNQNIIENNLTKNSYGFQRQKPQRKWVEESKIVKVYAHAFRPKSNADFIPQKPNFPNPSMKQPSKVSYTKGLSLEKKVLCDEQYDEKLYIESGCLRHMTGRKENLKDFRSLENAGVVKFGNNHKCQVKGYGKVTNGKFTVNRVAYIEGLNHNFISVSQLVVGTGNQVVFNEAGNIISKIEMNEVLLKSKRYDRVQGLPVLKFDNDTLCATSKQGKQHRQGHPIVIDLKIFESLELRHIDLCGPSIVETLNKKRYIFVIVVDFSRFMWVYFLRCFIMNHKDYLSMFQAKADEGIFLGYSHNSVAYRVLNKRTRKVEETFNLTFDDYYVKQVDKLFEQRQIINESNDESEIMGLENEDLYDDAHLNFDPSYPPLEKRIRDHPKEQVIGNPQIGVLTRTQLREKNEVVAILIEKARVEDVNYLMGNW
ncbi:uncharacterized protein LOC128128007 [Lactuca sativa]|uniref:uncharacterized protein LOC128128007 n=1 Tax=Lactuca sativa TaxID=4236 RepID=UPI0022B06B28|nr:uncharacterized protein LOC128128007 [Lactuca sativa]